MAIGYWIFASLLIVGTFIDLEHFIIPDRVTIGGIVAGVACSVAVPALMEADSRLAAGVRSLLAAALGYVILLIVLEAGKIAFGRKRIEFDAPTRSPGRNAGTTPILWWAPKKVCGVTILPGKKIDYCSSARGQAGPPHIWECDAGLSIRSRHC